MRLALVLRDVAEHAIESLADLQWLQIDATAHMQKIRQDPCAREQTQSVTWLDVHRKIGK